MLLLLTVFPHSHHTPTLSLSVQCTHDNLVIFPGGTGRDEAEMINITAQTHHLKMTASSSEII